ncbi:MAG: glucose-6-phosphate dehydrogenase [Planctomycetota bacterium]|jgi:glucose-6-phosphate 1-dehydrogenase
MAKIEATVNQQEMLCVEATAGPTGLVVFGASGDLAHRKLYTSLYELYRRELMSDCFYVVGCGRSEYSDEALTAFVNRFFYISGDYAQPQLYQDVCAKLTDLDQTFCRVENRIFYLSVPPFLYEPIIEKIGELRLMCPASSGYLENVRLVIEKPFGRDLASARQLDQKLRLYFDESQIYRIDHYLGKETVQNLLVFRFANSIFEPLWNRNYIERVDITIAEKVGVEHRAGYYDKSGALRDMFQNHMLQMMAMVAMEPPVSFEADSIRDEKCKLLRSIRPVTDDQVNEHFIRAQYGPGVVEGKQVPGYLEEEGVPVGSTTETFVAGKLFVDNWRWKGVPFYLRTGKRLAAKLTEILITFKQVPHSLLDSVGLTDIPQNVLRFQIQPNEGMYLSLQSKRPGSKICMSNLEMAVDYQKVFGVKMPEAYQRLLLDCMLGDQTLFTRSDSVEAAWKLMAPVLDAWAADNKSIIKYPSGSTALLIDP